MKIKEKFEGTIAGVDEKGRPFLPAGSKNISVAFSVPGDVVSGVVTARVQGNLKGKLESVIMPSPDRVPPRCPFAAMCGGCPWQQIDYRKQIELKRGIVNAAFVEQGFDLNVTDIVPAKELFYHRNRMDYVFGANGELGLKEPERWDGALNLTDCYMLSPDAVKVLDVFRSYVQETNLRPWNNRIHEGDVRYVVIREGKNTGERMVMLITSKECRSLPQEERLVEKLKPLATSFIHGINPEITDLSVAKEIRPVFGNPYLTEKVGAFTYRIPPNSFFQTNSAMSEVLRDTAIEFAAPGKDEAACDLYCGGGFLTLALAQASKQVTGIELDEAAIDTARLNAEINGITNITFSAGATEQLVGVTLLRDKPSVIVVDPPRAGLHPKALLTLLEYGAERMVYVSCNPHALARDLKSLLSAYEVRKLRAIDLFPHTPHIETVVLLCKK